MAKWPLHDELRRKLRSTVAITRLVTYADTPSPRKPQQASALVRKYNVPCARRAAPPPLAISPLSPRGLPCRIIYMRDEIVMTYLNDRRWKHRFLTWRPYFRGLIVRLTRDDFSSVSFFRGVMSVSLTINRATKRSSTQAHRSRNIYIYVCVYRKSQGLC